MHSVKNVVMPRSYIDYTSAFVNKKIMAFSKLAGDSKKCDILNEKCACKEKQFQRNEQLIIVRPFSSPRCSSVF